jgi:putative endopeptidase
MKTNFLIYSSLTIIALSSCKTSDNQQTTAEIKENQTVALTPAGSGSIDLSYLDKTIRPQDDFFQFSNGTWITNNPVPPSESRWGSFNELELNNKVKLKEILEECKTKDAKAGSDAAILGKYYASFMNMEARNKMGISPIKADLEKIQNLRSKGDIVSVVVDQHMQGINSLFGFGVGQDLMNVDRNITYIGQGGIGLPNKEYYTSENKRDILKQYTQHISTIFQLLDIPKNDADKMAQGVVEFETKLASASMAPAELRIPEKTYNLMAREEAIQATGTFNLDVYLSTIGIRSFDSIVVSQPDFLRKINTMMMEESMESWKDYLVWATINHYAGHLSEKYINANFSFYGKVLSGKSEMKPLEDRVIDEITNKEFGEILGKAFVEKYYSKKSQERVNNMVDNLLIVFKERIAGLEWMSNETKKEATNKLNSIGRKLGFPSKWEDFTALTFSSDNYISNLKLESKFAHQKNMNDLTKPVDKEKWGMPAHMVNAYYHPLLNEIAFPAGIMQAPFFDENAEDAVNYGRIGMVIGHEFTHGFDDMGSKFAADGSFKNWWTESDRKLFEEKTGILGATFSGFCPIDGHCVNPDLTMGENIADLGGLTMAFYAYKRTQEFKSEKEVNGFTPAQRFFISYAQLWKVNYTEEELKNRIANDPHSPGMYRVNGPLMNCPEFFEAFNVKEGDKMRNPQEKVARIW